MNCSCIVRHWNCGLWGGKVTWSQECVGGYSYCIENGMIQTLIRFGLIGRASCCLLLRPSQGTICSLGANGKDKGFCCRPGSPLADA